MKKLLHSPVVFLIFFSVALHPVRTFGSHMMGIDLTYECLGGNRYKITIALYRDCSGITPSTSFTLQVSSASCGQNLSFVINQEGPPVEVSQLCDAYANQSTCQGGSYPGVEQYIFSDTIQLPANCTDWVFSTEDCCRNAMINNLQAPDTRYMHVEATLNNVTDTCNNSPVFTNLPVPYICNNQLFSYNHGVVDFDGDSLVYSLVTPMDAGGAPIPYNSPYSATYPIITTTGTVGFDPLTGQFTITPNGIQVCVVSFLVQEYRNGVLIGSTMRDMQIIVVQNCAADPQMISGGIVNLSGGFGAQLLDTNEATICVGEQLSFQIVFADSLNPNPEVYTNLPLAIPTANFTTTGTNPITFYFSWKPGMSDLWGITYYFTVTIASNSCPISITRTYLFKVNVKLSTYAGVDLFLCEGDTMQLYAIGGSNFAWSPPEFLSDTDIQNPLAWPDTTKMYIVTSNLPSTGCKNTDSVMLFVVNDFNLTVSPPVTICYGGSAQLSASSSPPDAYTYTWTPATGLSDDSIANPLASPSTTTTYTLTVSRPNGCVKTRTVLVTVNPVPLTVDPDVDDAILCMGDSTYLHANPITGNCSQYLVTSIPYSPPASGGYTNISIYSDNVVSSAINLNFDFDFFCNWYDQIYVSSNGWLSFTAPANPYSSAASIPTGATPNNIIAFVWTDLNPGAGGASIGYKILGTTPNQKFILKFENVQYAFSSNTVTVYVILYEGTNIIEIYNSAVYSDFYSKTQGIENATGSAGYEVPGRNYTIWTAYSDAYRFTPIIPPPYTLSWYDQYGFLLGNAADISVKPDSAVTYTIEITDGSCVDQKNVSINVMNFSAGPDVYVCPGDSVQLTTNFSSSTTFVAPTVCGVSTGCNGTGGVSSSSVGAGSLSNSSTTYPAPYGNWYRNAKHQFLFTASELSAAGLSAGAITDLAWYVSSIQGTTVYYSYTIKMGCTGITDLTTWQSGLTTVFNPKTVNITTGWNNHNLDNDYNWDGVSNIVVEICYNNLAYSYTNNSISPYTTTGFSSCIYFYSDGTAACPYTSTPSAATNDRPNTRFTVCHDSIINTYQWAPLAGLSNSTIAAPKASPDSTTYYVVTVSNAYCAMKDTLMVTVTGILGDTATIQSSCSGICDGIALVTPTIGEPPFSFIWNDPDSQTTQTATGLCSGPFTVTVTDSSGCVGNLDLFVPFGPSVIPSIASLQNPCNAYCSGSATVTVTNGVLPYTYLWSPSTGNQSSPTATGLCDGTHYVTVTDSKGCMALDSAIITSPPPLATVAAINCFGNCNNNGSVAVSGGTPPYVYVWSTGESLTAINNLCTDTYSVIISDSNNCLISDTIVIRSPSMNLSQTDEKCNLPCSGSALASVTGGTPPYTFSWDDPGLQTDSLASGLCPGTFNVSFTDNGGCAMTGNAVVNPPYTILYSISSANPTCFDSCNASSTATPLNGTPPYTYQWDAAAGNQNTPTATGLCQGSYVITITDSATCTISTTVSLTQPAELLIASAVTDNSCYAKCDGLATITASGGTSSYFYSWSDGQSLSSAVNLCAGSYNVTVNDVNGCNKQAQVTITEPPVLSASISQFVDATCDAICDGTASVIPTGGTSPYNYLWSDPQQQTNSSATILCTGSYQVTVTDFQNCIYTVNHVVLAASQTPNADFYIVPEVTTMFNPEITFHDSSSPNVKIWNWNLGNGYTFSTGNDSVFKYSFPDPGTYTIELIVKNERNCPDTAYRTLIVEPDYLFFIPNSFSPNHDGLNDEFFPVIAGINEKDFEFYVFDRWGDLIFKSMDIQKKWDGTANDGKSVVQQDVYVWRVVTNDLAGQTHNYIGRVTVVK